MKLNPTPPPRSDHALAELRSRIFDGVVAPGALLAESAVARELGMSRVPVREALFVLEQEGLVEFSPSGRAYVKVLTPQDFEELHVLRLALETAAARLAAPSLRKDCSALEKNLVAMRRARSVRQITRLDLDFHESILVAASNARLLKLWRMLRGELELWLERLHRHHHLQTRQTLDETLEAHASIVACFRTRSPAECEHAIYHHIQGWREWLPTAPSANEGVSSM